MKILTRVMSIRRFKISPTLCGGKVQHGNAPAKCTIKFSASALGTTKDLMYESMTSEFQHLQDFTLVGKMYDHIESGLGFNRVMLNALVMATIEKLDPAHMSVCLCIPLFSTILFLKSPTKRWYTILAFWKRFEHPNFP
jgi:hypothetical protein